LSWGKYLPHRAS